MSRELLEFDPWTGIATYTEMQHRDKEITVHQEVDVAPLIEAQKRRRIEGHDKPIAGHMHLVANLDCITIMKMKAKGIDIFNARTKQEQQRVLQEIETNYPMLKATEKKGWRPKGTETKSTTIVIAK